MRTPSVIDGLVAQVRPEAFSVQNRQVVEVEVAVVGNFPVRPVNGLLSREIDRDDRASPRSRTGNGRDLLCLGCRD